ncbi:hypothetical protein CR194_01915 [Salipaludibacillus keqinensis]|uniref:Uncharacterized protein n=1 Tax=Salipaludibacillus keqinensis TaxID=2045207 RepID=A0A323TNG9_9BACI|nr:hypothetical protein [Salipaludibacillus keqinensis]PYZ94313.1 hypothetical protein CR194_01915 [Salipaludibacillus keqinensis]
MKGNAIVLLLPAVVMIGLFFFGYISLTQTEETSNEDLAGALMIQEELKDEYTMQIEWEWGEFPEDGIRGDDFIEITLPAWTGSEGGAETVEVKTILTQGNEVVYESNEAAITNSGGIAVAFPNEVQDDKIVGPRGEVTLHLSEPVLEENEIFIRYFHTWAEHPVSLESGIDIDSALTNAHIQSYWLVDSQD